MDLDNDMYLKCYLTFQKIMIPNSAFINDYMANSPNKWLQIASKRVEKTIMDDVVILSILYM